MSAVMYEIYRIGRAISRIPLVRGIMPRRLRSMVQSRLLMRSMERMPDRRYFEEFLVPAMVALRPHRVLDIGLESYSAHYRGFFPSTCEYWTLDLNPAVAHLGAPGRHVVGNALDLASYFPAGFFDLIILNGAFGFGINSVSDQELAMEASAAGLAPDGWLLVGWDRAANGSPVLSSDDLGSGPLLDPLRLEAARRLYLHKGMQGLPERTEFRDCSHVYDWFCLNGVRPT